MNAARLLQHFATIENAPDAIARLRRFVLDLAVRGKLTPYSFSKDDVYPLEALSDFIMGQAPPGNSYNTSGVGTVFVKVGEFGDRFPNHAAWTTQPLKYAKQGDVLICVVGATIGKLNLAIDCAIGRSVAAIRPNSRLDQIFLYYSLMPVTLRLREESRGTAQGVISRPDLASIPIWLPPVPEQHRIVARVDELMALCDRLEAAKIEREAVRDRLVTASFSRLTRHVDEGARDANADARFVLGNLSALTVTAHHIHQLRQTILSLAVCGRLLPQNPNDEPAGKLLKRIAQEKKQLVEAGVIPRMRKAVRDPTKHVERLPALWELISLGDVCNFVTSGSRGWAQYYSTSGPGFIRAQNIRFGKLRLHDLACVTPPLKSEGSRTQVTKGDLLIVITGAGVTNPALLDQDLGETYVSQHVGLVRPTDQKLSKWLLLCLLADEGSRAELVERAYGAGRPGLNLDNIWSLSVPLPPLAEQRRILTRVDELMSLCDQLDAEITTGCHNAKRFLEAVLHEALTPLPVHRLEAAQ